MKLQVDDQNLNTFCPHCRRDELEDRKTDSLGDQKPRRGVSLFRQKTHLLFFLQIFAPQLTVEFEWRSSVRSSWYLPGGLESNQEVSDFAVIRLKIAPFQAETETLARTHEHPVVQVAFISPLVLRRELETLLAADINAFRDSSIRESNPTVFWNLIYYLRRLALPTHLTR